MLSLLIACLSIFVSLSKLVQFLWARRKLYGCSAQFHGPLALPLIGNTYNFMCHHREIFQRLRKMINNAQHPMRFWLGPRLVLIFTNIKHVTQIMSSTKLAHKADIYTILGDFAGTGLVTGSGQKWKDDRRQIQPMFSLKYSYYNMDMMHRHIDIFMPIIERTVNKGLVDVYPILHRCSFDIIADIVFGLKMETQVGKNAELTHTVENVYQNAYERMTKPWLQVPVIFNLSRSRVDRDQIKNSLFDFGRHAIAESNERLQQNAKAMQEMEYVPISDQLNRVVSNGTLQYNEEDFIQQLITLFLAAEDTISITASFLMVCFGMYPDYQERALKEIYDVLGPEPGNVVADDLGKFKYLDMCIKDAVRLATIAPIILRKCTEEMFIGEYRVVPGCEVAIPIFEIHRDPEHWENPEHFHPEHFSETSVKERNPYANLAFSAGPRSCIGKHLAMVTLKTMMIRLLPKFRFSSPGKISDLNFHADISVRLRDGYNVNISRR